MFVLLINIMNKCCIFNYEINSIQDIFNIFKNTIFWFIVCFFELATFEATTILAMGNSLSWVSRNADLQKVALNDSKCQPSCIRQFDSPRGHTRKELQTTWVLECGNWDWAKLYMVSLLLKRHYAQCRVGDYLAEGLLVLETLDYLLNPNTDKKKGLIIFMQHI